VQYTQPGVYPDSATNFAQGYAGQPYSQLITIIIPQDTQVLQPPFPPMNWDSTVMVNMQGLPPGFTYSCWNVGPGNQSRCSWRGNTKGCAIITGNPTINDTGTYNLTINTRHYLGGSTNPINYPITYYKIKINAPSSVAENNSSLFELLQNYPNPVNDRTDIYFSSGRNLVVELKIFNVVGTEVGTYRQKAKTGSNKFSVDTKDLPSGVYLYSLSNGEKTLTRRMVVNH
jgi:hypothetical protein